jgi:Kef-type K+ transport system membrane component KefB/nucleotide-binding universal stress UspA family protein
MPLFSPITYPSGIFSLVLVILLVAPFLAEKVRLPGVIGLALAGILIGPHVLGLVAKDSAIEFLGSIGLIYIFFVVGVEIDIGQLRRESVSGLVVFAFTFGLPFAAGLASGMLLFRMGILPALLLGSVFASFTLVPYPIVSKLGLARQRSVVAAVSALILTDTVAIAILAAVARAARGESGLMDWGILLLGAAAWAAATILLVPKAAALFFRKAKLDGTLEFVFATALVFISAFTSRLVGLEPIIGAFVAGLLLNRFVPESGVLMNRVKFAGDALFVPFFMVYIGVLADPTVVFEGAGPLFMALAIAVLSVASKWLAAAGAGLVLGYSRDERGMLFGLTVNHAAAVMAVALVGFNLGLFSQTAFDSVIFLIIASCFVGPLMTQRSGKRLAAACEDEQRSRPDRAAERVLVAIANPSSIRYLLDLAFLLRSKRSEEAVYPVAVVPESANTRLEIAKAENSLAQAVVHGVSAGVPVIPATRVSVNVPEGIIQAAKDDRAGVIVLGWYRTPRLSYAFFGNAIEQVILGAPELVTIARITKPLNNVSQISLALPPLVERHPGFRRALAYLGNFASQTGAKLTVYAQRPSGASVIQAMGGARSRLHAQVVEIESWKSVAQELGTQGQDSHAFAIFSARPGEAAWHPAVEKIPHKIGEERPDMPILVFYLPEGADQGTASAARAAAVASDLFERAREAGRTRPLMAEASINDAIREMLRPSFGSDRKALARLSSLFTGIAQKQPIELEPGVLLLHAHVDEVTEPLVFFGSRPEGLRVLTLEAPARLLVLLCAPASQSPEAHLKTLGEIAGLLKGGRIAERMGLGGGEQPPESQARPATTG